MILSQAQRVDGGVTDDPWTDTLERRIAELEAAVTAQKGEFEPDGSELLDHETPRTIDHLAAAKRMAAQLREDAKAAVPAVSAPSNVDVDVAETADAPLKLTADLALEMADEPWLPDTATQPFETSEALTESGEGEAGDAPENVAVIDEEALQALVAAAVRDQLQGDLGERITRSVRKLVRREIQRALAERDLG